MILNLLIQKSYQIKKNTLINGQIGPLESFLSNMFSKIKKSNKLTDIAGDFNLNLLDHNSNSKG